MYIFNLIAKLKKNCLGYKHFSTFFQKKKRGHSSGHGLQLITYYYTVLALHQISDNLFY